KLQVTQCFLARSGPVPRPAHVAQPTEMPAAESSAANLVGWRLGVLPSSAVLEANVRASRHRDLRQVVLPILPELARSGRTDGGARLGRRPYDHLALGPAVRSRSAAAAWR